eukprot:ctg_110.g43
MTGTEALVGRANESKQKANEAFKARRFHNAVEWYTEAIRLLAREALHCDTDEAVERWALAFRAGNDSRPTEDGRKGQEGESVNDRPNSAAAAAASGDRPSAVVQALVVLYANRALARIKVEEYGFAISDAGISIALSESEYPKAFYRRASALFALGRYKQAMSDFKRVLRAAPQDMEARAKLKECERRAREKAFAAAIDTSSDAAASPCLTADMSTVPVDADYTGPRIVPAASRELDRIAVGDGSVTRAFCEQLLEWYRAQHKLPKKYVMQLVTAAYVHLREYPSLVDVKLGTQRRTVGAWPQRPAPVERHLVARSDPPATLDGVRRHPRPVLRPAAHLRDERPAERRQSVSVQRRLCGPRLVERGGDRDAVGVFGARPALHALRGAAQVHRGGVSTLRGAIPRTATRLRHRGCRGPARSGVARRIVLAARRPIAAAAQYRSVLRAAHRRSDVGAALERPAKGERLGAEQARRRRVVWSGRHPALPGRQRAAVSDTQPRDEGRGIRGGGGRPPHHHILSAQLLRSDGQQGRIHPPRRRHAAAFCAVCGRPASTRRAAHDVCQQRHDGLDVNGSRACVCVWIPRCAERRSPLGNQELAPGDDDDIQEEHGVAEPGHQHHREEDGDGEEDIEAGASSAEHHEGEEYTPAPIAFSRFQEAAESLTAYLVGGAPASPTTAEEEGITEEPAGAGRWRSGQLWHAGAAGVSPGQGRRPQDAHGQRAHLLQVAVHRFPHRGDGHFHPHLLRRGLGRQRRRQDPAVSLHLGCGAGVHHVRSDQLLPTEAGAATRPQQGGVG